MAIDTTREFIEAIEKAGELVRITQPVRARLEIAEIADRCMKSPGGGPALLFDHVILDDGTRSAWPVAINLFGSMRRMCVALGVENLDEVGGRISERHPAFPVHDEQAFLHAFVDSILRGFG